jgi:hypothetical protein
MVVTWASPTGRSRKPAPVSACTRPLPRIASNAARRTLTISAKRGHHWEDGQWTGRPSQPPEWMDTTDEFYGFRQLVGYPQIRLAVCKDGQWDSTKRYTVPSGFRWASKTEIEVVFAQQREPPKSRYAGIHYSHYAGQGGWDGWHGLEWKGIKRWIFLLNDSLERGCCIHAGDREGGLSTQWSVEWMRDMLPKGKFAGLVCIEILRKSSYKAQVWCCTTKIRQRLQAPRGSLPQRRRSQRSIHHIICNKYNLKPITH